MEDGEGAVGSVMVGAFEARVHKRELHSSLKMAHLAQLARRRRASLCLAQRCCSGCWPGSGLYPALLYSQQQKEKKAPSRRKSAKPVPHYHMHYRHVPKGRALFSELFLLGLLLRVRKCNCLYSPV